MSRQVVITAGVAFTLLGHAAAAQEGAVAVGSVQPLTLRAAIAEALERNPEVQALRHEYEAARAAPAQERYLAPPMLETRIWGWPVTTLNPVRTDMYMFMAEQELPGRGKRAARTLVAEREADTARQQAAARANEVRNEVQQAFVDLAVAREIGSLYERQAPVLQDIAEAATLRYATGQTGQHHTVTALVELTRIERDRIATDERAQLAEARLSTLLGRPADQPVEPLVAIANTVDVMGAEQVALERHPELSLADALIRREEAELARLRSDRRPDFVIGGGYMLTPGEPGAWTARAGITWPNAPWSRGRLTATLALQEKRLEAAKSRREVAATRVRQRVREAVVRLAAAERQVRLIDSAVLPQIEHAFEIASLAYQQGEGAFGDVLESRRLLLTTQIERAEARANVGRAQADLAAAVGHHE
jgi:outer membrane protein, heavy metal efflux system